MSYTLTLDMPDVAESYMIRHGQRMRAELNAVFVAMVMARVQYEQLDESVKDPQGYATGLELFKTLHSTGPVLDDSDLSVFNRVKDLGRTEELA